MQMAESCVTEEGEGSTEELCVCGNKMWLIEQFEPPMTTRGKTNNLHGTINRQLLHYTFPSLCLCTCSSRGAKRHARDVKGFHSL